MIGSQMDNRLIAIRISDEIRIQRLEELSHFDEIKSERDDLKSKAKLLKIYIEKLQSILDAKELTYPTIEFPDEIPF